MKAHRRAAGGKGERAQAVGVSRGGRTSKLHALSDEVGRPRAFHLTGGEAAYCRAAEALLHRVPGGVVVIADGGCGADPVQGGIEASGAAPDISPGAKRRLEPPFSPALYRGRNAVERMFGRLKDFWRIATRYDKLAQNYLAAVHIAAAVSYWL